MKKTRTRLMAMLLAVMMALTACGGGGNGGNSGGGNSGDGGSAPAPSNGGQPIKEIVLWEQSGNRELEEFFILHTEQAKDLNVLTNAYSGLLELDPHGKLGPGIATEWSTEDNGLTWTFKLRDGVTWVDVNGEYKADCNAQDWLTAMEWILNYEKNGSQNTSMLRAMVAGAEEYYQFTKDLAEDIFDANGNKIKEGDHEAAKALNAQSPEFQQMVTGIQAPDDHTLIYTCTHPAPYFETVTTSACLYPVSQAEIDEKGVDGMVGMSNLEMWYNGPYTITEYINNNTKTLTKNESYWDKNCSLFDTVRIVMIENTTMDDTLYETGEVDVTELNIANLNEIVNNPGDERNDYLSETRLKKFSYQLQMNFHKKNPDGSLDDNWNTAIANENFRQSLLWGVDLTNYNKRTNPINPKSIENLCFTMKGLLTFSDGRDYTDRVIELLGYPEVDGDAPRRFDEAKALDYKQKAMAELSAKGVTFPVQIDYYIQAASASGLDNATVLKECIEGTLGSDYVTLNILTYVNSITKEVTGPGLHSINGSGWGADYGDVENFHDQIVFGSDSAYYANSYTYINDCEDEETVALFKEFTSMVNDAKAITDDLDARYEAFAQAEAFLINHALTWPLNYENAWQLTKINDYTKINAPYGIQNYTYKNWETSTEAYTAEDYAKFAADFENGN
ncbi:MAG: hypothetical protein K2O18_17790 [Oscillospiraceae bacterium]|nr:hypothetical protein [Oscillospiraceae bacterium]